MWKIIAIIIALVSTFTIRNCIAISEHELVSPDGNIWEVLDELEPNKEYIAIFDMKCDDIAENDEILRVLEK